MQDTLHTSSCHVPVLLEEVLEALNPQPHDVIVDGTFGGGGYARAVLEKTKASYVGIDRDPEAIQRAQAWADQFSGRLKVIYGASGSLNDLLHKADVRTMQGFVADLGMSSDQLEQAERGFSFMKEGPLDMRMDSRQALTAAILLNTASEAEITHILWFYGEEPLSRKIAQAIVTDRVQTPFETTTQLAQLIKRLNPRYQNVHPATRTFQALRIAVNDEITQLRRMLDDSTSALAMGGRLVFVSFHSLEDRLVKQHFRHWARPYEGRLLPGEKPSTSAASFFLDPLYKGAIKPTSEEVARNPRARSARLRAAVKRPLP